MRKKAISKEMFDFLKNHIVEVEKEKESLIREHYPENTDESMDIKELFKNYMKTVSDYLADIKIAPGAADTCPFVIINSIVEVQDTEDMDTYKYRIVLPYSKNADIGIDCASCLSPLGRELLLKKAGQKANIQIPTGTLHYMIKNISLPELKNPCDDKNQAVDESAARTKNIGLSI